MSETYPNKGTRETLFAGHTPSSVGIGCKVTNYFSYLQIYTTKSRVFYLPKTFQGHTVYLNNKSLECVHVNCFILIIRQKGS